jgi:polar amino acid transport system substrate-binding protein
VVAAGIPISAGLRGRFAVTQPFFKIPARFVARKDRPNPVPQGASVQGKKIAVVGGTAHEAFVKTFYPAAAATAFPDLAAAEAALRNGQTDYVFADGLGLALWIAGSEAADCCAFVGGPYLESRFFGEGIGFVLRKEDETLRQAFDFALQRLWDEGKYAELYLRFFPVSPF